MQDGIMFNILWAARNYSRGERGTFCNQRINGLQQIVEEEQKLQKKERLEVRGGAIQVL